MSFSVKSFRAGIAALMAVSLGLLSCEGPIGPDGSDASFRDILGPEAHLVSPAASSRIYADTVDVTAEIIDGSEDLDRIYFTLNGQADFAGDTLFADPVTLSRRVDLVELGMEYGLLLFQAITRDTLGNHGSSPDLLAYYPDPADPIQLAPGDLTGHAYPLLLPSLLPVTLGDTLDTTYAFDGLALAFTAPTNLRLDSLSLILTRTTVGYPETAPVLIGIAEATADGPAATDDTLRHVHDAFSNDAESIVDLSTIHSGSEPLSFAAGDTFFVTVSPAFPSPTTEDNFTGDMGVEVSLISRDSSLVQPGIGDLWLRKFDSEQAWHHYSKLAQDTLFYPRVRIYATKTDAPSTKTTSTSGE